MKDYYDGEPEYANPLFIARRNRLNRGKQAAQRFL